MNGQDAETQYLEIMSISLFCLESKVMRLSLSGLSYTSLTIESSPEYCR